MPVGWSIDGKRIEFGAAFPAGKLVVKDKAGQATHELKLASKGEWPLTVGDDTFKVTRVQKFLGPKTTLADGRGARVPTTNTLLLPGVAAPGSQCAPHQEPARYACARCGTFVCRQCAGSDLTHCPTCVDRLLADEDKNAAAMAYFAPAVVMIPIGGLLLGLLGAGAGAIAVAIARRTESKPAKVLAAIGLYAVAFAVWLLVLSQMKV